MVAKLMQGTCSTCVVFGDGSEGVENAHSPVM